jgi:hypothetical protein
MRLKILASIAMLSVFSTSYAKEIYSSGDWKLDDLSDKKNLNGACILSTSSEAGNADYRLEFVHSKDKKVPTEIQIRKEGKGALAWTATLIDGSVMAFANSGNFNKQDVLWNIPQNSSALVDHLEAKKDLKVKPADGSKDMKLQFSSSGFKKAKEKMEEKCLGKATLVDSAFEDSFLNNKHPIDPMKVNPEAIKELRRLLYSGYEVHVKIGDNGGEMNALRTRFQSQLNESNSLRSLIDRLGNSDIPTTIQNSKNNDDLEARKRSELASTNSLIVSQKSSVSAAEATLAKAQAAIAPFEDEHGSRLQSSQSARQSVNQLASRLNTIDQGVAQTNARINQLNNEAGALQDSSNRAQNDLRMARMERGRAEQDFRAFDPRQEVRRRLSMDRMFQDANRELPPLQNAVDSLERALVDARGRILAREAELRVCQSQSTTGYYAQELSRLPAQERAPRDNNGNGPGGNGNGGGRGGRPGNNDGDNRNPPNNPTPTPNPTPVPTPPVVVPTTPSAPAPTPSTGPDCSVQIESLRQAKLVEADLGNQSRDAKQRLNASRSRAEGIENRVNGEVERQRNDLAQRAEGARRRTEMLEGQIMNNDRRIDMISRSEMPQQMNILNSLQNERPGVQSQYDQTVPVAARLDSELAGFERKVGWEAKVDAVENSNQVLDGRRNDLRNSEALKRSTENVILNCQSERNRLNAELAARQLQKSQSENRLVDVKKSLEPFELEKSKIETSASDLKNQLAGIAVQFETKLTE